MTGDLAALAVFAIGAYVLIRCVVWLAVELIEPEQIEDEYLEHDAVMYDGSQRGGE